MPFGIKSVLIEKQIDNETVYNKNYLNTIIKYRGDEVTDFYDKKYLS